MKSPKLALLSVAALFVSALRTQFATANAPAAKADSAPSNEIADLAAKFDLLQKQNADYQARIDELQAQLDAQKAAASAPITPADELGLGPLQLPAGLDPKDVVWRKRAGLTTTQAVQAAVAQKAHDDAARAAAAKKK